MLCSDTSEVLQEQIDGLYKYCGKWHMIVSLSKTKILIFNQKINDGRVFKVGDDHIEVVNEYKYLGFIFSTHLKDPLGAVSDHLLGQAQKATYQARKLSGALLGRLSPTLAFKVFDTQILQIMEYCSEVWYKVKAHDKHEKFHLSYIKSTLGVTPQTTTDTVMSDTRCLPLQLRKNVNVIKYWLRLAKLGNEDPVHNAFNTLVQLHNFGQRYQHIWNF